MGLTLAILITVAASIFAAIVIVLFLGYVLVRLVERGRQSDLDDPVQEGIDAEYRIAVRAMNEAASQPWRNVLD